MNKADLTSPAIYDLADRLDCGRAAAIGHVKLLEDFAGTHAPRGDVGKFPNGAIARACDFAGSADSFVAALVDAGWLCECSCHRLLATDWPKRAERWVRSKLKSLGEDFIDGPATEATSPASPDTADHAGEHGSAANGQTAADASADAGSGACGDNHEVAATTSFRSASLRSPHTGKKARGRSRSPSLSAADFEFPDKLDVPDARAALDEFLAFRRRLRKPLLPESVAKLIAEWAGRGPEAFRAAVDHTVARGWQGLRLPDDYRATTAVGLSGVDVWTLAAEENGADG